MTFIAFATDGVAANLMPRFEPIPEAPMRPRRSPEKNLQKYEFILMYYFCISCQSITSLFITDVCFTHCSKLISFSKQQMKNDGLRNESKDN